MVWKILLIGYIKGYIYIVLSNHLLSILLLIPLLMIFETSSDQPDKIKLSKIAYALNLQRWQCDISAIVV